jgi:nitrite reductase/ring-hydroxylating ferredoxin subunit
LDTRFPFPLNPDGWYTLAFSAELAPGQVLARQVGGRDVVLFRTDAGEVACVDAYCPHMGAHFGHGGTVEGDQLRCPFHFFEFDTGGVCTRTGYGTKPPEKARLGTWPVVERNHQLMVYLGEAAPTWEVPALDTEGWMAPAFGCWRVKTHPQETTENSVDMGHFGIVHRYFDVEELAPLHTEGPYLSSSYAFSRANDVFGGPASVRTEFRTHIWGLGYSLVELTVLELGLRSRVWVLPTPMGTEHIELRAGLSVPEDTDVGALHWGLRLMPRSVALGLVQSRAFAAYVHDLNQDFDIWENKLYIHPPALAQGDGPIPKYRKWARQFYPELRVAPSVPQGDLAAVSS